MSLRALRTLQAIARHGTFAKAGEAVGLTQSAVSLQIKALEEEFGVRLFDRTRKQLEFTEAGKIVLAKSGEVLALYAQIPEALSDEKSLVGRLKVGAMPTALTGVIPDTLVALNRAHPRIRIHVTSGLSGELAYQVAAGDLDVAVTLEPDRPHPANLSWSRLYEDRFWLIAPAALRECDPLKLLAEQPFIKLDARAWSGRAIDRELRRLRVNVREEMVLGSPETITKMVEKGLGVSIVTIPDDQRTDLQIACLPFGDPQLTRPMGLLERRDRRGGNLAAALALAIKDVVKRQGR